MIEAENLSSMRGLKGRAFERFFGPWGHKFEQPITPPLKGLNSWWVAWGRECGGGNVDVLSAFCR